MITNDERYNNIKYVVEIIAKHTLLDTEYKGYNSTYRIQCKYGHVFNISTRTLRDKYPFKCAKCPSRNSISIYNRFVYIINNSGGKVFDQIYITAKTPYTIQCKYGHITYAIPNSIINNDVNICRICSGHKTPKMAMENFQNELSIYGAEWIDNDWKGASTPHTVICSIGHICYPKPTNIARGYSPCNICANRIYNTFYVVNNEIDCVKFGITHGNGITRLNVHKEAGLNNVVRLFTNLPYGFAERSEKYIKDILKDNNQYPIKGLEYFSISCQDIILNGIDERIKNG